MMETKEASLDVLLIYGKQMYLNSTWKKWQPAGLVSLRALAVSVMKFHRAEPAREDMQPFWFQVLPSQARTAGKQSSSRVSSARKPAGILNAAVLSGRFLYDG